MRKQLLILLMGTVFLGSLVRITLAQKTEKPDAAERLQAALQAMDSREELIQLRTLNRRAFKKKDGKLVTFISTEPLNYLEDDNQLHPIDINLSSEALLKANQAKNGKDKSKYRYHALKNSLKARFSDESDGGAQLEYQKHSVEFVLLHQNKRRAVVEKNKIHYKKVLDNCDLVYTVLPGQVKDELIFSSAPKTPIISYKLNINEKLVPKNGPEGSVELVDAAGKTVFRLLPAVMFEKDHLDKSKSIETRFHWNKNELYCDMILDMSWLKNKKRHYPIVVDPVVTPAPTSMGTTGYRALIHCPEGYGEIKCSIDLDGPGWHGYLADHDYCNVYFKDLTANRTFLGYGELGNYSGTWTEQIQANHDYEVYLFAGKARHISDGTFNGRAWATIEYGGDNGLFEEKPGGDCFTGANNYVVLKSVYLKYTQTIKYNYQRESTNGNISEPVAPYFRISPGSNMPLGNGYVKLSPGYYQFELSPSNREHYRVELEFPLGTGDYERKIVLRTNPGSIESTFMLPSNDDVLLYYRAIRNGNPSSQAFPSISITTDTGTPVYSKAFPLDYYNTYDGGNKVSLQKEKLYTLTVSRGRNGGSGWGGVNLDFLYTPNKTKNSANAAKLQLFDKNGNPVNRLFAAPSDQLRFNYQDEENHTLKSYKLFVNDEEYPFENINAGNGWITIPHRISDFKLFSGITFHCKVEIYDGFDFIESALENFTVDSTPPEVDAFSGEIDSADDGTNSLNLVCQAHDGLSAVQKGEISWKVNGEYSGSQPWSEQTVTITGLPSNAKVEVTFSVTDTAENTASFTKSFYTYPEKAALAAPVAVYTSKPGKYHPTLKFTKTGAPEYRIQRFLKRNALPDLLEYDTGFMDAGTLSTVTMLPLGLNIISPAGGSRFGRPAYITLTAYSEADFNTYKVDFYANGTLLDTTTHSPFRVLWNNVPPGTYTLTAVATDVDGLTQTSPPVTIEVTNIPPTVRIISPVSGTSYSQPADIYIRAEATDPDSDISKVEFFSGDLSLGVDTANPYSINWTGVLYGANGSYTLTAKATDSDGATTVSDPVTVYVTNAKPEVSIASPKDNQVFISPASITVEANASDSDGMVSRVDFYLNDVYKESDYSNSFSYTLSAVPIGRHTIRVKAVDNNGAETWSTPVYINVIEPPDDMWCGSITKPDYYSMPYYLGHWEGLRVSDNVSGFQWFFRYNCPSRLWINGQYEDVRAIITTNYWVPRDVHQVINYARNDDYLTIHVNGHTVFGNDCTPNSSVDYSRPIVIDLNGNSWNSVTMTIDNRGGSYFELGFPTSFKNLIQQKLSAGETVYMKSSLINTSTSSMSINDSEITSNTQYLSGHGLIASQNSEYGSLSINKTMNEAGPINPEYYSYVDLLPIDPHQTYVYRITTRNGDKTAEQDSKPVPVMNNIPEITGVEPGKDSKSYSNGAFSIRVTGAEDYDGDPLKYYFSITGPETRESQDPSQREFTVNDLKDGTYTWTARIIDGLGGEDTVSGTVVVDKNIPTALFSIGNGALYTVDQSVQLTITEASTNVDKVRLSNDKITWTEFPGSNQTVNWDLTSGDGRKVVYLQAHKATGDVWGPVVERSITLDTTGPEVSNFHINQKGGEQKVTFDWIGGKDATSGLSGKVNIELMENGTWTTYRTDYQENKIEIPAPGYNTPVKIRLQLIDNAGNLSMWALSSTGFSLAAPGGFNKEETVSGFSETAGHYIDLKLNPAEGAIKYKIECLQNPGGGDTAFVPEGLAYRDIAVLPHQTYKYKVFTYNSNSEITEGATGEFTIVNAPPETPLGVAPAGLINHKDTLVYTFDKPLEALDPDGDPLTVTYFLSTDGQNYKEADILTGLTEGITYWWKATIDDGYQGVKETTPVSFSIDATAPTITVDNLSNDYAREHRVRINVSDSGSGVKAIKINGALTTNLNSVLAFNSQGANYLVVEAEDQAGNTVSFTHTYYVDQEPPTCQGIRFNLPERNGTYLASSNIIPVIWNAVDPETGVAKFKYTWSGEPNLTQEFSLLGQQGNYRNDIPGKFVDGQTYYLNLQAENYLGINSPVVASPSLLFDHTGPILSISHLANGEIFNGTRYLQSLGQLALTVSADDPHTGISKIEYALLEKEAVDSNTRWFRSLDGRDGLKENVNATDGKIYYLAVRATNGTDLNTVVFSEPFIVDGSKPVLSVLTQAEQRDNQIYLAQVAVSDPDTMVVKVEYGIGTEKGSTDLSRGLPGTDSDGWFTINYPGSILELRQFASIPVGTTYYITVKATNISGVTAIDSSTGTRIIASNAPVVRDDGNYTSDNTMLHFEWSFPNNTRPVKEYRYKIRLADGTVVKEWQTVSGANAVLVKELDLSHNSSYYCDVQAVYADGGASEIGSSDGILIDRTPPEIIAFNVPKYAGKDGINLSWAANDPESGVQCYAGIGANPGENGVTKGWLYLGNLKSFRVNQDVNGKDIQFIHNQKYYVSILVQNGAGAMVQQISPAVVIDLTPPDPPVVIDEGNYTNRNDQLKFSWKWPVGDAESGIREYWISLTSQQSISGNEKWFTGLQIKEVILRDLDLIQGSTYYLAVKAINNAGAESIGFSDGVLIDTTAPTPPVVTDFGDYSLSNKLLDVAMVASDAESGVAGYTLSLGMINEPDKIIKDKSVLSEGYEERLSLDGLNLDEGKVYYFTVAATNNAGDKSMISTSDGIMVDSKPPVVKSVIVQGRYLTDPARLVFDWTTEYTPSGIVDAQYAISNDPNGANPVWQSADLSGCQIVTGLNLEEGETYYVFVRVQNRALAENSPGIWSVVGRSNPFAVDTTPPEILSIHSPKFMGQHFLLQWEARDSVSGIGEYRYAVGSYRGGTDITGGWVSVVTEKTLYSLYRDDLPLQDGHCYYISVMAKNGAGIWSPVSKSDAITTDLAPPVISKLAYGSKYINISDITNGIRVDWAANDEQTGIAAYRMKLVTIKDHQDLDTKDVLTNETSGTILFSPVNLQDGQTYYLAFQAQNQLGIWSEVFYSEAILVDLTIPVLTIHDPKPEMVTNSGEMEIRYNLSELSSVAIKLEYPNGFIETPAPEIVAGEVIYYFNPRPEPQTGKKEAGNYILSLFPTDLAGNRPLEAIRQLIRINATPTANLGPDITVTKGTTVTFTAEAADGQPGGWIKEYQWDFGDNNPVTTEKPECNFTYVKTGTFRVTLRVKDNDDKWSELTLDPETDPAVLKVVVTNTYSGKLQMDEDWDSSEPITINGDVTVPKGVVLTVKPGATVNFSDNYQILVYGKLIIEGTATNQVVIGNSTVVWNGLRLEKAEPGSRVEYAVIQNASVGLVLYETQADVEGCIFKNNRIGLHILGCSPSVRNCSFLDNLLYGVKEDAGASPVISGCGFNGNKVADYYEDKLGIINPGSLN